MDHENDRDLRQRAIEDGSLVPAELVPDRRGEWLIREHGLRVFALVGGPPPHPRPGAELPEIDVYSDESIQEISSKTERRRMRSSWGRAA
jgi:hypothetical protein